MTIAEKIEFELVTPDQVLVSQFADLVVVPGSEGYLGVMPGHVPLVSALKAGVVDIHQDGLVASRLFIASGIVEITRQHCTVLTEEAFPVEQLDREQLEQQSRELQEDLEQASDEAVRSELTQHLDLCREKLAAIATGN